MEGIVIGKRIPIGAAFGGLVTAAFEVWNMFNPEVQFSVAVAGAVSTFVVAAVQIIVVNKFGVTTGNDVPKG